MSKLSGHFYYVKWHALSITIYKCETFLINHEILKDCNFLSIEIKSASVKSNQNFLIIYRLENMDVLFFVETKIYKVDFRKALFCFPPLYIKS